MKISDLSINDYFETHSGELFQVIENPAVGCRKAFKGVVRIDDGEILTVKEFEKTSVFRIDD